MIDRARRQGNEVRVWSMPTRNGALTLSQITAFTSFCGGLPAPEASDVPLSYKFSWAPRGMLTAASNPASFRLAGRDHAIAGEDLLRQAFPSVPVVPSLRLEGLANRNSLDYLAAYGLDASLPTVLRGTLRYAGTARLLNALRLVGLLDPAPLPVPVVSWWDFLQTVLHRQTGRDTSSEGAVLGLLDDLLAGQSGCASAEETAIALQQCVHRARCRPR
jgi:alpha-aminoadipic semialdehyde synthase